MSSQPFQQVTTSGVSPQPTGLVVGQLIDQYSALSHKQAIGDGTVPPWLAPSWIDPLSRRRVAAYTILEAYTRNVARYFLPTTVDHRTRDQRREYGDAALVVSQALAALLGEEQSVIVDPLPEQPSGDDQGADTADEAQQARQDWLDDWAARNRFWLKLTQAERNALKLGDGVYWLAWSETRQTVTVRDYDPGFYFPVLTGDEDIDEFPQRVHLVWEILDDQLRRHLRRITFSLEPLTAEDPDVTQVSVHNNGDPIYGRRYPWQADNDETATKTCRMTDATWNLSDVRGFIDDLSLDNAMFAVNEDGAELREHDLRIDFIPIIHVPNTPEGPAHFGQSILGTITQVLDDIGATDTDLQVQSTTVALSALAVRGSVAGTEVQAGPGQRYNLPPDGDAKVVDTSTSLDALLKYSERLDEKLSENSRLSPNLLGKLRQSRSVPSGVALALSFGPTQSLVRELRQIRDEKYPLLLKMVQRLAIAGGILEGPIFPARVAFGSYLPADKQQAVDQTSALLNAHAISTETAVGILIEAGFPIDDALGEVERINAEKFAAAVQLLDATGDMGAVRDFLGLGAQPAGPTTALPPPVPPPPPTPGTPTPPVNTAPPLPAPPSGGQPGSSQ